MLIVIIKYAAVSFLNILLHHRCIFNTTLKGAKHQAPPQWLRWCKHVKEGFTKMDQFEGRGLILTSKRGWTRGLSFACKSGPLLVGRSNDRKITGFKMNEKHHDVVAQTILAMLKVI